MRIGIHTDIQTDDTVIAAQLDAVREQTAYSYAEHGNYDFSFVDYILAEAQKRGQKVMLRFPLHAARPGPLELPEWFCKALNFPQRRIRDKQTPLHPLSFETYANMIRTAGAHLDGDSRITALDMSLISAWGEGDQMNMLPEEMWKPLVDAYMHAFRSTPISAQFNHPESVFYANTYRPVGIRADLPWQYERPYEEG